MIDFLKNKFQSPFIWERIVYFVLYAAVAGAVVWDVNKFSAPMVSETTQAILTGLVGVGAVGFGAYVAMKK